MVRNSTLTIRCFVTYVSTYQSDVQYKQNVSAATTLGLRTQAGATVKYVKIQDSPSYW